MTVTIIISVNLESN